MRVLVVAAMAAISTAQIANAQYVQHWQSPSANRYINYVGCENTDADNAKEVVLWCGSYTEQGDQWLMVIDGATGAVEWNQTPHWHTVGPTWLVDVDNDNRCEILFQGEPAQGDSVRWYCYGYSGGGVHEGSPGGQLYQELRLGQNCPNPASGPMAIEYTVPQQGKIAMRVYNSAGRLVRRLQEGERKPGRYVVNWDGRDDSGEQLSGGPYFYELEVNGQKRTRKMVLVPEER